MNLFSPPSLAIFFLLITCLCVWLQFRLDDQETTCTEEDVNERIGRQSLSFPISEYYHHSFTFFFFCVVALSLQLR